MAFPNALRCNSGSDEFEPRTESSSAEPRFIEHTRSTTMKTDRTSDVKGGGQYAEVDGVKLYYETQ